VAQNIYQDEGHILLACKSISEYIVTIRWNPSGAFLISPINYKEKQNEDSIDIP
jgi:hypothetical protein